MTDAVFRRHFDTGEELCAYVREQTGPAVILKFSRGKDAQAAYHQLRRFFDRIVCVHLDALPEPLRLETEGIARWERFTGEKVLRYVQPAFVRKMQNYVYQPPGRWQSIQAAAFPSGYDYEAINDHARRAAGVPRAWAAVGSRAADSILRRRSIKMSGSLTPSQRKFLPVFDWNLDRVCAAVEELGVGLPVDYELFGRTFDGISCDYLGPLRERYPDDYERVLRWFPLARLGVERMATR